MSGCASSPGSPEMSMSSGSGSQQLAVHLPPSLVEAIVALARAEQPNEACGLIIGDRPAAAGGRALRFVPTRNKAASPLRYEIHPEDLLRLTIETDDADEVFWAIV